VTTYFDEMRGEGTQVREVYREIDRWLKSVSPEQLAHRKEEAEQFFRRIGITFAVYGEGGDPERLIPFDIIPRLIERAEWDRVQAGLVQRVKALNAFIADVYHDQEILKAGIVPKDLVLKNTAFCPFMQQLRVPGDVYTHICGIDMVRVGADEFYVLEDNARTPSGVSYMLENREITMRLLPEVVARHKVAPVDHYCDELLRTLSSLAPRHCHADDPTVCVLTPGIYNSAYYEHSFIADQMGVELVEGPDLYVEDDRVYMRTTEGPKRVDVIYKRIDDDFLDPKVFREDSALGVPGLMSAYKEGYVTLANAVGGGIADDKAIYVFVPKMIEFYLGEKPILNNVPTFSCSDPSERKYVLEHLEELVVKEVHGSGGYGMLIGPTSTSDERTIFANKIKQKPDAYIAQPTLALSTCPTFVEKGVAPRHVDLRPFILVGEEVTIVPGGLTRVAMKEGSLVVNSSQGGGTKDTWVVDGFANGLQQQSTGDGTMTQSQSAPAGFETQSQNQSQ